MFLDFVAYLAGKPKHFHWSGPLGMSMSWPATVPDAAGTQTNVVQSVEPFRLIAFIEQATKKRDLLLTIQRTDSQTSASLMARGFVG
jgi:hypothetical protein